jgi:hypothetical protein
MPMALCAKGYIAKLIGCASHSERAMGISSQLDKLMERFDKLNQKFLNQ